MNRMVSHFQKDNQHNSISSKRADTERQPMMEMVERKRPRKNHIEMEDKTESRMDSPSEPRDSNTPSEQPSGPDFSPPASKSKLTSLQKRERILSLMQSVLCKNFPAIPCKVIMQDEALNKLIQKSIQQIILKQLQNLHKSTISPKSATHSLVINSEDLSNFLEVSNTGYFEMKKKTEDNKRRKTSVKTQNRWSHEKNSRKKEKIKGKTETKRTELYNSGHKKMRKFYPHKIKYKDKKTSKTDYREYSDEKLSMSVEGPDIKMIQRKPQQTEIKDNMAYKVETDDQPIWRIDYMKHGIPSMNMFGYDDDRLSGKLMKSGPNAILDESRLEQSSMIRKEILHPDVYIKKNLARKGSVNFNSEGID